jgi:hypothetical protein
MMRMRYYSGVATVAFLMLIDDMVLAGLEDMSS